MAAKKTRKKKEDAVKQNTVKDDSIVDELVQLSEQTVQQSTGLTFSIEGPVYLDGCLHFSPNDLIRYELLQERVTSVLQQIGLNTAEKERTANAANKEIERISKEAKDKIAALDGARLSLVSTGKTREEELRKFQLGLGVLYNGLDIQKISYDDSSGRIFVIEEGENRPVPEPEK